MAFELLFPHMTLLFQLTLVSVHGMRLECGGHSHKFISMDPYGNTICTQCSECPPGTGVSSPCQGSFDTVCEMCPDGTYSGTWSRTRKCQQCTACSPHQTVIRNCTSLKNAKCAKECDVGYYMNELTDICEPCSWCFPDQPNMAPPVVTQCIKAEIPRDYWCMPSPHEYRPFTEIAVNRPKTIYKDTQDIGNILNADEPRTIVMQPDDDNDVVNDTKARRTLTFEEPITNQITSQKETTSEKYLKTDQENGEVGVFDADITTKSTIKSNIQYISETTESLFQNVYVYVVAMVTFVAIAIVTIVTIVFLRVKHAKGKQTQKHTTYHENINISENPGYVISDLIQPDHKTKCKLDESENNSTGEQDSVYLITKGSPDQNLNLQVHTNVLGSNVVDMVTKQEKANTGDVIDQWLSGPLYVDSKPDDDPTTLRYSYLPRDNNFDDHTSIIMADDKKTFHQGNLV
ncbi:uncharacterized protein LOC144439005 [Glandiceps talaboti]